MATNAPQDDWHKTGLRLPKDLHGKLHEAAAESGRSYNGEILARLQQSFDGPQQSVPTIGIELDSTGYPVSWDEIHAILSAIRRAGGLNAVRLEIDVFTPELVASDKRMVESNRLAQKLMRQSKQLKQAQEKTSRPKPAPSSDKS
jgi:hypothetical protein